MPPPLHVRWLWLTPILLVSGLWIHSYFYQITAFFQSSAGVGLFSQYGAGGIALTYYPGDKQRTLQSVPIAASAADYHTSPYHPLGGIVFQSARDWWGFLCLPYWMLWLGAAVPFFLSFREKPT